MNVLAGLHPLDGLPLELHCVTTPLCHLGHFAAPFAAKCVFSACLNLRVQSIRKITWVDRRCALPDSAHGICGSLPSPLAGPSSRAFRCACLPTLCRW